MKVSSFSDVDRELDKLRAKAAITDGHQLSDIDIGTSATSVPHKLGRLPRGYVLVGQDADARIWRDSAADRVNLYLKASAAVTASIWVY